MALPRQVLTISSQVAAGPVGNSAIVPALIALGVTPVAVPTILLSNHPGHGRPEGLGVPAEKLTRMLDRLVELDFLTEDTVVLTGYFAHADQVEAVATFLNSFNRSYYLCDPVLGDTHKGLYVADSIASAIRDRLVPAADGLTPNVFELGWLAGGEIGDLASARRACRELGGKSVVVTSLPAGDGQLTTALIEDERILAVTRPKQDQVPHGTGDFLSGLLAGRLAQGHALKDSLGFAIAATEHVMKASEGTPILDLAWGLKDIAAVTPFAATHE
jgi:pyridoxine kinase